MSNLLNTVESWSEISIPERLKTFYLSEIETYEDHTIANLPGWDPSCEFDLDFSLDTISELMDRHSDWIQTASESDQCQYIAFSSLDDETDFLAVNITNENCPIYFGNHETGGFQMIYKTLDNFLQYLDSEDVNPMELFPTLYEKAKVAFFENDDEKVITLLGDFFDKYPMDPGVPGPFMKQIPEALNIVACSHYNLEQFDEAMNMLELACNGIFCRNAFLNRIKFKLLSSEYDMAMQLCTQGLDRFSDSYSTSFINLYKGVIFGISENYEDALACFALMSGDMEKSDFNILTPIAAVYTHYTPETDFQKVFSQTLSVIQQVG
ncbi:hypothetical protein [Aquimarina litoralis]|uniref:hypothetical protein n=1 Tax=Aquimarina litoralis TaxID=584605 RepID=UPI001C58CE12|nr:hypothetical protein [Aquimarina litoralis]MBW1295547.1 hypothetical protein [Aquimarina litoralis]